MAFQQRFRPYETLIRHNDNGTIGSHHVRIQELYDDVSGAILYAQIQPPQQLDGAGLEAVVGQAFVQATAQIAALQSDVSTLTQQHTADAALIAELRAEIAALKNPPAASAPTPAAESAEVGDEAMAEQAQQRAAAE